MTGLPRTAIVDANLIAPFSVRVFVGHLCEAGRIRMVGTEETCIEEVVATRQVVGRRPRSDLAKAVDAELEAIGNWREHYRAAGLWVECSAKNYLSEIATEDSFQILQALWAEYKTDPEDYHLAEAAVMCGLDALHTSNMNMNSDDDWLRIMAALRLTKPPALCRRNGIPSWCLGAQFDSAPAATVIDLALSAMRPSPRFREALMAWARRIEGSFPDLATKTQQYLARRPERDLQARHEELSHRAVSPVTREFLSTSSESR